MNIEFIHPLIVHFPIALWMGALLFYLLYAWRDDFFYWETALWLHGLGTLAGIAAIISGEHDEELVEETLEKSALAHNVLEQHETLAKVLTGFFLLLFIWAFWKPPRRGMRAVFVLLFAVGVAALVYQGHLGGRLVFEFLLGTQ